MGEVHAVNKVEEEGMCATCKVEVIRRCMQLASCLMQISCLLICVSNIPIYEFSHGCSFIRPSCMGKT